MGAAEPASFDTVSEVIRTNHYETCSEISNRSITSTAEEDRYRYGCGYTYAIQWNFDMPTLHDR